MMKYYTRVTEVTIKKDGDVVSHTKTTESTNDPSKLGTNEVAKEVDGIFREVDEIFKKTNSLFERMRRLFQ